MYINIRASGRLCHPSKNIPFTRLLLLLFLFIISVTYLFILLLISGDIKLNPGLYSVDDSGSADTSDIHSTLSLDLLTYHLSILHINAQSILPKIDLVRGEDASYDILKYSESWLKSTIMRIENCMSPFITDRNDRESGGLIAYVRDTLSCKRLVG